MPPPATTTATGPLPIPSRRPMSLAEQPVGPAAVSLQLAAVRRVIVVLLAMLGIRADRSRTQFMLMTAAVLGTVWLGFSWTQTPLSALWGGVAASEGAAAPAVGPAAIYVAIVFVCYYVGHPLFYLVGGQRWLRRRFGMERAYTIYSSVLGVLFANLIFGIVPFFTATGAAAGLGAQGTTAGGAWLIFGAGLGLASGGLKAWATFCLGVDGYYYADMFREQPSGQDPVEHGPYRWLSDPMYSLGYFPIYSGAILAQSGPGFMLALLSHLCIFLFNITVERRAFERIYGDIERPDAPPQQAPEQPHPLANQA